MNKENISFSLTKISDTDIEPITLADAKQYLRVDFDDDDALITSLIRAAREYAERVTGLCLTVQQWRLALDRFPYHPRATDRIVQLPRAPLTSVDSVQFVDGTGATVSLDPSTYVVDSASSPPRIAPDTFMDWPRTRLTLGSVKITFTAGYDTSIPPTMKSGMLLTIGHWYANRESVVITTGQAQIVPIGANILFNASKLSRVGYEVAA